MGGILDENGKGKWFNCGTEIDYISGWCFAIKRETYNKFGLFDQENLEFAYGEDADFSLRLRQSGAYIHALHLSLVHHFENKTILQVRHKRDCSKTFEKNHSFIKEKWNSYIRCKINKDNALALISPEECSLQSEQFVV
jgi:GT2 family glycosyltransferase